LTLIAGAPVDQSNETTSRGNALDAEAKDLKRKRLESLLGARHHENDDDDDDKLITTNPALADTTTATTTTTMSGSLQEMWAQEAKAARREVERLLQTKIFSMASPTRSPDDGGGGGEETIPTSVPVALLPTLPPRTAAPVPENCLNGRTPEQYLLDVLLEISNVNEILNPDTAQGQAFNFILGDPAVREDVCQYPTIGQRYALGKKKKEEKFD